MPKLLEDFLNRSLFGDGSHKKGEPMQCHLQLGKRVILAEKLSLASDNEQVEALLKATKWDKPFARKVQRTLRHATNWSRVETQL